MTRRLSREMRPDTRLGSRQQDETRFLHNFSEILSYKIHDWKNSMQCIFQSFNS